MGFEFMRPSMTITIEQRYDKLFLAGLFVLVQILVMLNVPFLSFTEKDISREYISFICE